MNWNEHMSQAELLLKEAEQENAQATVGDQTGQLRALTYAVLALAHTNLAGAKRIRS